MSLDVRNPGDSKDKSFPPVVGLRKVLKKFRPSAEEDAGSSADSLTLVNKVASLARGGNVNELTAYLERDDIDPTSDDLKSALFDVCSGCSVACNQRATVEVLLRHNASVDEAKDGSTPIAVAGRSKSVGVVALLVTHNANYRGFRDKDDNSILFWACMNGHMAVVEALIEKQADFTEQNTFGQSLLHVAAKNGHGEMVEKLCALDEFKDVDRVDSHANMTALHYACTGKGRGFTTAMKVLLNNGADPMMENAARQTALHIAHDNGTAKNLFDAISVSKTLRLLALIDNIQCTTDRNNTSGAQLGRSDSFLEIFLNRGSRGGGDTKWLTLRKFVWSKIVQNDDTKSLETLRDSNSWRKNDNTCTFEGVLTPSPRDFTEIFNDCSENGILLRSFFESRFRSEIDKSDFHAIFSKLTHISCEALVDKDVRLMSPFFADIIFLCLICGRLEIVGLLLQMRQFDMLPTAITIALVVRAVLNYREFPEQINKSLEAFADNAENVAIDVVNKAFLKDNSDNKFVTMSYLAVQLSPLGMHAIIDLAAKADCTNFLSLPICQLALDHRWYGPMLNYSLLQRYVTTAFPPIGGVFMRSVTLQNASEATDVETKSKPSAILFGLRLFKKPNIKFFTHAVSHMVLLVLFSYCVLRDLHYCPSATEIVFWVFFAGFVVEELHQLLYNVSHSGAIKYFTDKWNWFDLISIATVVAGIVIRLTAVSQTAISEEAEAQDRTMYAARMVYCVGLILYYLRLMAIVQIFPNLGPKVKMLQTMLVRDLLPMLVIFLIFLVPFSITFQSSLYPNGYSNDPDEDRISNIDTAKNILQRGFYGILAPDYPLEDLLSSSTTANTIGIELVVNLFLIVYVLIVSILLINLLIAQFSNTVKIIDDSARALWLADRYYLIEEYNSRSTLPPPLNLLTIFFRIGQLIVSHISCCDKHSHKANPALLSSSKTGEVVNRFYIIQAFALKGSRYALGIRETQSRSDTISDDHSLSQKMDDILRELRSRC